MTDKDKDKGAWRLNRQVSLSFVLEMVLLGSLIVGSWFNLQTRLDLLGRDVELLLEQQRDYCVRLEAMQEKTIAHEYRLRTLEGVAQND
jgi:hypothetical protein